MYSSFNFSYPIFCFNKSLTSSIISNADIYSFHVLINLVSNASLSPLSYLSLVTKYLLYIIDVSLAAKLIKLTSNSTGDVISNCSYLLISSSILLIYEDSPLLLYISTVRVNISNCFSVSICSLGLIS